MERIPRAIYTKELREEVVKLVTEGGLKIPEVGRRLSVSASTIRDWVKANKEGKLKEVGKQQRPLTEVEMELARVKRELAKVKMELDILKNATAYFAKESLTREHGLRVLVFASVFFDQSSTILPRFSLSEWNNEPLSVKIPSLLYAY
jgi:transposase